MRALSKPRLLLIALAGVGALLAGCTQSRLRIADDFGQAVSQDLAAQITDPDAAAKAGPPPPADGARAALAQTRYQHDAVIQPVSGEASGRAGGSSGAGSGAGAGVGMGTP